MGAVLTFDPGAALARIEARRSGFAIDCRSPKAARRYDFNTPEDAAEFAVLLRDEGGWSRRFREGADGVRTIVADIDAESGR